MVSPLDLGLFNVFSWVLPVILVYALIFGILSYTKIFESTVINQIIAIVLALLMLLVPSLIDVIKYVAPWITVSFIVLLLAIMAFKFMGATDENISSAIIGNKAVIYIIITIFVIIVFAGIGKVYFGPGKFMEKTTEGVTTEGLEGTSKTGERSFWETIFHPNVLGFLMVMLVAVFTMLTLSGKAH